MEERLRRVLSEIDGKGYGAYRSLVGAYSLSCGLELRVDHVQPDPFAPPSRIRAKVPPRLLGLPRWSFDDPIRRMACEDFLLRSLGEALRRLRGRHRAFVYEPDQEVLRRSALRVEDGGVEVRLYADLPASGRRVLGLEALRLFLEVLPRALLEGLTYGRLDRAAFKEHVETVEDNCHLRGKLEEMGLVCFVADGAILPRASGTSTRPMSQGAIPFESPPELAVEVELKNRGRVRGMGIPRGVTLITGGGYHGKSTLLEAIELGVYPHVPGDGRELVATVEGAVKVRAEDGRVVRGVDISPFISNLPQGIRTDLFSTDDASGSTSQAASIQEAVEMGATLLILDEDTSATNFMIRDRRMQALISKGKEPITPFIDQVRNLSELGISTVMVVGGSGDYLDVADVVIMMDEFRPLDVTKRAREIAREIPSGREREASGYERPKERVPLPGSLSVRVGGKARAKARGTSALVLGREEVDISVLSQLVEDGQARAIAQMWRFAAERGLLDGRRSLREISTLLLREVEERGFEALFGDEGLCGGDLALPRAFEIAAVANRSSSLRVRTR